jgi:hypothetical protein
LAAWEQARMSAIRICRNDHGGIEISVDGVVINCVQALKFEQDNAIAGKLTLTIFAREVEIEADAEVLFGKVDER